jgi:hypothetical protein
MGISHLRTEEFNPLKVSANRINSFLQCGVAFKYEYVDLIPQARSGSAALFGAVLHSALENWTPDRSQSLTKALTASWQTVTSDTPVYEFLKGYQEISFRARAEEDRIRKARPEIKAVRMTKDWKNSDVSKEVQSYVSAHRMAMEESPWRFTEKDPLPGLYDESFSIAARYEAANKDRNNTLCVEFNFEIPFYEFQLAGYVDAVEEGTTVLGEPCYLITDYKSYRREPAPFKDYRQTVFYHIAWPTIAESLGIDPLEKLVLSGCDYLVLGTREYRQYGFADVNKILSELRLYQSATSQGIFLPAEKGRNADYCAYPDRCCLTSSDTACPVVEVDDKRIELSVA